MPSPKDEFELNYWRAVRSRNTDSMYHRLLALWSIAPLSSIGGKHATVLEVGTGPRMGVLPFLSNSTRIGIDPLYSHYLHEGLLQDYKGIILIEDKIERILLKEAVFCVVCANALDHGDSDEGSIRSIANMLVPGGLFYLHVHLRKAHQLNEGHDHSLSADRIMDVAQECGLHEKRFQILDRDPVEPCSYETLMGVWQKGGSAHDNS